MSINAIYTQMDDHTRQMIHVYRPPGIPEPFGERGEEWRKIIKDRVEYIERWESHQRTNNYATDDREIRQENNSQNCNWEDGEGAFNCPFQGCGRTCRSKAGLTVHQKRVHKVGEEPIRFPCDRCGNVYDAEGNMKNHRKSCTGNRSDDPNRRRCHMCNKLISKSNIARHRSHCRVSGVHGDCSETQELQARVYRAREKECTMCGRMLSAANMARHMRSCGRSDKKKDLQQ